MKNKNLLLPLGIGWYGVSVGIPSGGWSFYPGPWPKMEGEEMSKKQKVCKELWLFKRDIKCELEKGHAGWHEAKDELHGKTHCWPSKRI